MVTSTAFAFPRAASSAKARCDKTRYSLELPDLALHDLSKFIRSNEETNWGWNVALNYTSSVIEISGVHSLVAFLLDLYMYFGTLVNCSH